MIDGSSFAVYFITTAGYIGGEYPNDSDAVRPALWIDISGLPD